MKNEAEYQFYPHISRFHRLYTKALTRRLDPHGVLPGYLDILFRLWEKDDITQKALHAKLDIEQATLSNTLKRMERDGLISNTRNPEDRRLTQIVLTEQGKALKKVVLTAIEDLQGCINVGLTISDRKYFRRILKQMTGHLDADLEDGCLLLVDEIPD